MTTTHMTQLEVRHDAEAGRYELYEGGAMLGVADYRPGEAGVLVFPHTEIVPHRRGEGLGAILVRGALEDVRQRGFRIVPACWFVAEFLETNPAYADLVI
jgi:predicted GNAT family acetyltransferase